MIDSQVLKEAIKKYGDKHQLLKLIEECSELTNEICDYLDGDDNREHIIEEMVDVQIMIDQLIVMLDISKDEIFIARNYKLRRLENTLNC